MHGALAEPAWTPSVKARQLWAINAALFWAVLLLAQIGWALLDRPWTTPAHVVGFVATGVLGTAHIVAVPRWRYRVHRWEVGPTAVYTRTGWLTQERRIVPISRIQTVDIERGPIDRILGLATVTVTTASSAGAVEIAALDEDVATRTAAQLTEIAARNIGDAL